MGLRLKLLFQKSTVQELCFFVFFFPGVKRGSGRGGGVES